MIHIFQNFAREHFLCIFYWLFLLKRDCLFVNNTSHDLNRTAYEVSIELHVREFKLVKLIF